MKLNKVEIKELKKTRPTFMQWVLNSKKAFRIVFIMGMIVPPIMFGAAAIMFASSKSWWMAVPLGIICIIMLIGAWQKRMLLKDGSTDFNIMSYVYKNKFNK